MLFEVRVLDSKGKIKKLISARELRRRHWKSFEHLFPLTVKGNFRSKKLKFMNRKMPHARAS